MVSNRFRPKRTWFDRLSLYRYVAVLLLPLFVWSTHRAFTTSYPFTWRALLFWVANVLLWAAIIRDTWEVMQVRREIHKSIRDVTQGNEDSSR